MHAETLRRRRSAVEDHRHCLVTDGTYEEQGDELRFLAAAPPTPARMMAVLAKVRDVVRAADDDDLDPALAACVQLSLAGPHPASGSQHQRNGGKASAARSACQGRQTDDSRAEFDRELGELEELGELGG